MRLERIVRKRRVIGALAEYVVNQRIERNDIEVCQQIAGGRSVGIGLAQ
jgi:hypothetical protein